MRKDILCDVQYKTMVKANSKGLDSKLLRNIWLFVMRQITRNLLRVSEKNKVLL